MGSAGKRPPYTDEELRNIPTSWPAYGTALRILARRGVMECESVSAERKAKAVQEVKDLLRDFYAPRVGDQILWELFTNGFRYRCVIREVRPDGWAFDTGDGASFHPKFGFIVSAETAEPKGPHKK